jgi:hypothetical protein
MTRIKLNKMKHCDINLKIPKEQRQHTDTIMMCSITLTDKDV